MSDKAISLLREFAIWADGAEDKPYSLLKETWAFLESYVEPVGDPQPEAYEKFTSHLAASLMKFSLNRDIKYVMPNLPWEQRALWDWICKGMEEVADALTAPPPSIVIQVPAPGTPAYEKFISDLNDKLTGHKE